MMDASTPYDLTYRGRVGRADNGAAVPGALVEIWHLLPEEVGPRDPFVRAQTDPAGEFRVTERLRSYGAPQDATIRVTPPAGSGLQPRTYGGQAGDIFASVTGSNARYTYRLQIAVEPVPGS